MKSAINNVSLLEEDANLSDFRRRNNILIVVFATFFISLTLIITALIFNLVLHVDSESAQLIRLNPAVRAFYDAANCNTASCREAFSPIVNSKAYSPITDPNHILILSLHTAARELYDITVSDKNCSDSLRHGSGQIYGTLAMVQLNPFVEKRSNEEREWIVHSIALAEEDLKSCVDYLGKVGSTAVGEEVRAKVHRFLVYLRSSEYFAVQYEEYKHQFYREVAAIDWRNMVSDHMFIICMCGLQLLFIFFLYWTLFRFG